MNDFVKLIKYALRSARNWRERSGVALMVIAGVVSGLASTAFIAVINQALHHGGRPGRLGWVFLGLLVLLPLARFTSGHLLVRVSQTMFHDMRMQLCRRILDTPLRDLELIGAGPLLASMTEDVGTLGNALGAVPMLSMQITIVACCLGFMAWLSWQLLLVVLAFMVFGLVTYLLPIRFANRQYRMMRQAWDSLFGHLRGLAEGSKELKLHRRRRGAFLGDLVAKSSLALRRYTIAGNTIHSAATAWGSILFFVLIGVVLFVVPGVVAVTPTTLTGFTLAILYMLGPLDFVLNFLPQMGRAGIAMRRMERLGGNLAPGTALELAAAAAAPPRPAAAAWSRIELAGATHSYFREREEDRFTLGPIDLTLRPGELVFLVGGNGSGKTTLAKLLTGLYAPETGEVRLDGQPVAEAARDDYRQLFSVVFQDFFLFEQLLGLDSPRLDQDAAGYLGELHLERKVKVEEGKLSTIDLSQGQKKRLALLTAYLEDRPILLFDEWAADQDPQFKKVFYLKLLGDLKARGKTVVVISHDDHYYSLADRIVKLDSGQVEFDGSVHHYLESYGDKSLAATSVAAR